jgi:multiple sugar transport system substrate-binding protein
LSNRRLQMMLGILWFLLLLTVACAAGEVKTKVTYALPAGYTEERWSFWPFIEWFEANNPDIEIEVIAFAGEQLQYYRTTFAGGAAADILWLGITDVHALIEDGLLIDLYPLYRKDSLSRPGFLNPNFVVRGEHRGKLGGMSTQWTWRQNYYLKNTFAEAGLPFPSLRGDNTWTWEEFVQAITRLHRVDGDGKVSRYGYAITPQIDRLDVMVRMWGGQYYDTKTEKVTLDSPQALEALTHWADVIAFRRLTPPGGASSRPTDMILKGTLAVGWDPDQWTRDYEQLVPGEFGLAPAPRGPAGTATSTMGPLLGITVTCKNPEAAWRVIRAKVLYDMGVRDLNQIPARQHPWMYFSDLRNASIYRELVELCEGWVAPYGYPWIPFLGEPDVRPVITNAVAQVMRGERGVEVVVEAVRQANEMLEQLRQRK